jgi:hypothetical protein
MAEDIKNLCTFAIEWMDGALDKTNPRDTNLRENWDIHEESTLEFEKEDDINEHGSYFMSTSLSPCSHEKSPESISLSNIATHKIFNPLILLVHKDFKRVDVDAYVYHKYCRSRYVNLEIGTRRLVS